jgi:hypothetical protein
MDNSIIPTPGFNSLNDARPESRAFTNVKFYNHLIAHKQKGGKHSFCSIDCMTREFEGRSSESARKLMRVRLTHFQRWTRDEQGKFIVVPKAGYGGNNHNEALAAKIFDPLTADDRDRELVATDLNRALHRKEISDETYHKIFELVYPLLNDDVQTSGDPSPT